MLWFDKDPHLKISYTQKPKGDIILAGTVCSQDSEIASYIEFPRCDLLDWERRGAAEVVKSAIESQESSESRALGTESAICMHACVPRRVMSTRGRPWGPPPWLESKRSRGYTTHVALLVVTPAEPAAVRRGDIGGGKRSRLLFLAGKRVDESGTRLQT